jgi:hypothetical protein
MNSAVLRVRSLADRDCFDWGFVIARSNPGSVYPG